MAVRRVPRAGRQPIGDVAEGAVDRGGVADDADAPAASAGEARSRSEPELDGHFGRLFHIKC